MALDRLQPLLVAESSRLLERQVSLDGVGFALAGGPGIRVDGLRIADDPRFSNASFAEVGDAVLRTDPAALLRGRLEGSVDLDRAVVRLIRIPGGAWNVETLGDEGADTGAPRREAGRVPRDADEPGVRLTSARVRDGLLEVSDRTRRGGANLVVHDLDLDVSSPDPRRPATLSLDGFVGSESEGRTVEVAGEIGPFTSGATPRWLLEQVKLERVPLSDVPGAPESVRGELTFRGRLESSGDHVGIVVANATGNGDLELTRGSLGDGNLGRELVATLDNLIVPPGDGGSRPAIAELILAAAAREPALAAVLSSPETAFDELGGSVRLAASTLELHDVALETAFFDANASGTLTRAGELSAAGKLDLEPAFASAIAQAAPIIRPLLGPDGRFAVPFRATGTWPKIRLDLDLVQAVASAASLDPRRMALPVAAGWLELLVAAPSRGRAG
jgi:hypothetical protein